MFLCVEWSEMEWSENGVNGSEVQMVLSTEGGFCFGLYMNQLVQTVSLMVGSQHWRLAYTQPQEKKIYIHL